MNPQVEFEGTVKQAALAAQRALEQAGLQVQRSFELPGGVPAELPSAEGGIKPCACQYTVLLVYPPSGPPAAVTSQAHGMHARLEVILDPNSDSDLALVHRILGALESAAADCP
jgi:hypothetical protein